MIEYWKGCNSLIMEDETLRIPVAAQFEVNTLGNLDDAVLEDAARGSKDGKLLRELINALDEPLLAILSCRNRSELVKTRNEVWDNYFRALRSFGDTLARVVDSRQIEVASVRAMLAIERDLARSRGALFSEEIAQQFEFSGWLVSRIQAAGHKIAQIGRVPEQARPTDVELSSDFISVAAWGQFHYDCVLTSMKFNRPMAHGIQESIRDGLRAWVNAAAIIEEALSLRTGNKVGGEVEFIDSIWDNEDGSLLEESTKEAASLSNDA